MKENQNYIIEFDDYELTVSNIDKNVIDQNASSRSFSSLAVEHATNSPQFTNHIYISNC